MVVGKDTVMLENTIPATDNSIGPGRPATKPPVGYVPLAVGENTSTIGQVARSLLGGNYCDMTPFTIAMSDGSYKRYMARVDAHYHQPPPAGSSPNTQAKYPKPWGWHKGVTIYKSDPSKTSIEDYVPNRKDNARISFLKRIDEFFQELDGVK